MNVNLFFQKNIFYFSSFYQKDTNNKITIADNLSRGKIENLQEACGDNFKKLEFIKCDLTKYEENWARKFKKTDVLIHLADIVAGIGYVLDNESYVFRTNLLINNLVKLEKNHDYSDVKISIETIDKRKAVEYLEDENAYTEHHLKDTKNIQKKLFDEIKGRIKLDDESLPYKDHTYEYWTKTTTKGNYSIKLRKKIGSENIEEIWNGDKEKEKLKTEYFGVGDLEVSNNDKYLGYSLDLKGSEYFTIYIRDIDTEKLITEKIEETSGSITFSLDDKYIFYSKLDEFHRPRKIYRHEIGTKTKNDELIFEEKNEAFTVGIGLSPDEKYFFITTSDHNTSEQYYFGVNEKKPIPKLIKKRKRGIIYSVTSWKNYFYCHTNEDAEDFKIDKCSNLDEQNWETYIAAKNEVLIGGLIFLNDWIIRGEKSNALGKLFVKNTKTDLEEELILSLIHI